VFCAGGGGGVRSRQAGLLRVNCLDCADRTNAAQATVALAAARAQLAALAAASGAAAPAPAGSDASGAGAGTEDETASELSPAMADALRALWAAHGDALSRQYTRTAAQRRDRSAPPSVAAFAAAARDFGISVLRYFHNNHRDADACDADALVCGAHVPCRRQRGSGGAAAAAASASPFPRSLAARAAHIARRLPLLQARAARSRCSALLASLF
jgi:hypothetical protein